MRPGLIAAVYLIGSCQSSIDILDEIIPVLGGTSSHQMHVLQFEVNSQDRASSSCQDKYTAYESICNVQPDTGSCSGLSSCYYKKQRAFSALINACSSAADQELIARASRQYVSDMGRCLRSNNQFCYTNGQTLLSGLANGSLALDSTMSKICTSPAGCMGKALAWSTDPVERDACRSTNDGNRWCVKQLMDLQHLLATNPSSIPDMSLFCTPCTRRYGFFPKYKMNTYCKSNAGSLCGDRLVGAFNRSGTLAKSSPCANLDITMPGSCTDACRDFLTGVVAETGCCLGSALQQAIAASDSSTDADQLKAQIGYYQSDCGIKIPDGCDAAPQASVSFTIRISNLNNPAKKVSELCSLISKQVGDWFQIKPGQISCIYSASTAGSFLIDFFSSSDYVQDDLDYVKQRSADGTLQIPLITSDYWTDTTAGIQVTISNAVSDSEHIHTSHALSLSSTLLPIIIMIVAIFILF